MAKKSEIIKAVLGIVGVTGLLLVAIAMPGLARMLQGQLKGRYGRKQLVRSLRTMEKRRLIEIGYENNQTFIRLTKEGRQKLIKFQLDDLELKKSKHWDKKWRLLIFDIPEEKKVSRKMLVWKLKRLGMLPLQKSVWVWPYDCEDEIDFITEIYRVGKYVRVVRADYLDIQSDLIRKFNLSK